MSENAGRSRKVSFEQLKTLIDFMGLHVELATGNCRSLEARHTSKRLREELTKLLNNCRTGTRKTSDGWSKYWSDYKNKLKNKVSIINKRKRSGSLPKKGIRPLSKLEKRALCILGPHFEKKKSGMDEFNDAMSSSLPEIKLEAYQESAFSEVCNNQNESSDRLLDGDKDCEQSADSIHGFDEESDQILNEPLIQSMYPKWLIDVEKKRAEAELIRARAEEQRASTASRTSEAMLMQAEALKRMSDAAIMQADAIMRIAVALESRSLRTDMLSM